jgi:hypothetical protein
LESAILSNQSAFTAMSNHLWNSGDHIALGFDELQQISSQNIEFAVIISLLLSYQRANAWRIGSHSSESKSREFESTPRDDSPESEEQQVFLHSAVAGAPALWPE